MYVTITAQQTGENFAQSSVDFVNYLEKENEGKTIEEQEHFFNQYSEEIYAEEVIREIDGNKAKLKRDEPKFYSITVNPSSRELKHLQNSSEDLKAYTKELMKEYAKNFNREINGRPVNVDDIKYYAKIEHKRTYKGTDKAIIENQSYATKILELKKDIRKIEEGNLQGNKKALQKKIAKLEQKALHKIKGKRIVRGMQKEGFQTHIHIIVSRKDMSNKYSLSPGSKYTASNTKMHGKAVKRGFNRNNFFKKAEEVFDKQFKYKRNYVETYKARKAFIKNPKRYFASIMGLPTNQKVVAFKLLGKSGVKIPLMNIPTNKAQLAYKLFKKLKQTIDRGIQSSSIGV
ncbi:MobB family relaxase [uncultured Tenacibaculum sp.]|uniref:MobB family relaxase n=1 Tax=uncultured Tenacibaculum sp. TaxID=174713 RepID=UPI0026082596|nr:MobB family relaxase [uncultured Tenacibaculum sp.]